MTKTLKTDKVGNTVYLYLSLLFWLFTVYLDLFLLFWLFTIYLDLFCCSDSLQSILIYSVVLTLYKLSSSVSAVLTLYNLSLSMTVVLTLYNLFPSNCAVLTLYNLSSCISAILTLCGLLCLAGLFVSSSSFFRWVELLNGAHSVSPENLEKTSVRSLISHHVKGNSFADWSTGALFVTFTAAAD